MGESQTGTTRRITVDVSPDRLQAWVQFSDRKQGPSLASAEIIEALTEAKIVVDQEVRSRVSALVEAFSGDTALPDRFLIAQGSAPLEAQDGTFVLDPNLETTGGTQEGDGAINYFEMSNVVTVGIGTVIGKIVPPTPGKDGIDVYGNRLKPKVSPTAVQLGSGVELSENGQSIVVSKTAGRVLYERGKVSITEALQIEGDVDFKTGSIDSSVDVYITGNIRDNFQVRSEKSVNVGGCIEQATVLAQEDVVVRNGILGRGKGVLTAGGRCVAKFCQGAALICTNDVQIAREVINSSIYTDGRLSVSRGCLVGGSVYAKEGAEVAVLGKPCGTPTEVIVGIHPSALTRIKKLEEDLKNKKAMLQETARRVKPLVDNLKRLSPDLKQRVAELVGRLQSLRQSIAETERDRENVLSAARPSTTPSVIVSKIIHEGARIRIGYHECRFDKELKGPVRIELRKVDNVTRLVAVSQLTSSITTLPTRRVDEPLLAETGCPDGQGEPLSPQPAEQQPAAASSS